MNYWFKRKKYGWGWTPVSWQGWLVTLIYIALIFAVGFGPSNRDLDFKEIVLFVILPLIFITLIFIWIAYKKGEKPRWQWGDKDE